uniref:GH14469p n=1 Tax=Drosophila melanogaster TaxID=7227 RepID=Q8T0Q0_DROME|nr:GH14469p [Drosophila melanogaster]
MFLTENRRKNGFHTYNAEKLMFLTENRRKNDFHTCKYNDC